MIEFLTVRGDVLIEDRSRGCRQARAGMRIEDRGDILVATNYGSRATLRIDESRITLPPRSYLRVRPTGESWWDSFGLGPADLRLGIEILWTRIADSLTPKGKRVADGVPGGGGIRG